MQAKETYINLKNKAEAELNILKIKIRWVILARLLSFLGTGVLVYFLIDHPLSAITTGIVGILIFIFFIKRSGILDHQKRYQKELILINEKELKALSHDFSCFENGNEFNDAKHAFSNDIDLFGENSFFQYLNRSKTQEGKSFLAQKLCSNDIHEINEKQKAIIELSKLTEWRQQFSALAALIQLKSSSEKFISWLKDHTRIINPSLKYLLWVFPITSLLLLCLAYFTEMPNNVVIIWFFIGLGWVGYYIKKTNLLLAELSKFEDGLNEYAALLDLLEKTNFTSKNLLKIKSKIKTENRSASSTIKKLYKIINQLNNRHNFIIGIAGNGLGLWDLQYVYQFEKWLAIHKNEIANWFDAVHEIDALISMGTYCFNHSYTFPELIEEKENINAQKLGHPLIKEDKCIRNDFQINYGDFHIVTGANMAGKSTFLRTISIAIVSANNGLPVYADSFSYFPVKLITSMRSTDSLSNEESYFFSELKRLRFIIDNIETEHYFVVLDEILKGTNSKDKEEGSKKFVRKLIELKSSGIIATHDLSLCSLTNESKKVSTKYFDATIIDGELHFDYQFKDGICQNMNASYLLEKMKIV